MTVGGTNEDSPRKSEVVECYEVFVNNINDNRNSKIETEPDNIVDYDDEIMDTDGSDDENQEEEGVGLFG